MNQILSQKLNIIKNDSGDILKYFSKDSKYYTTFGEVYFSEVKKSQIKAWKMQKKITMNITVPIGSIKFVFYDINFNLIETMIIGKKNYRLLHIPPSIWYGFKGLNDINLISSFINEKHNDNEMLRLEQKKIKYDWNRE